MEIKLDGHKGHYDVEMKRADGYGRHYDVEMKGRMQKGAI